MAVSVIFHPSKCNPVRQGDIKFDSLSLKSGVNYLSDGDFAKLQDHPDFPRYQEWGALKVQESDVPVETIPLSDVPANLAAYSVDKAEDIVDTTYDVDVLNRWLAAETRVTLKRILEGRIQDLQELS